MVLGDCNPDLLLSGGDVQPVFGQVERLVDSARLVIGGSGAITACGAARLGLRTALVAVVGDDLFGRFLLQALRDRGVDVSGCVVDRRRPTGLTVVLDRGDDRAMLTALGTIAALRPELVDERLLGRARHVHVSSYFLLRGLHAALPALLDRARRRGLSTSVDPNWDPEERWDSGFAAVLAATDCLLPNAAEAARIARVAEPDAAAGALAGACPTVVVKAGGRGAFAHAGGRVVRQPALPVEAVDGTGAGDSFDAGFLTGLLAGWPLERCLGLACACGSLSTREAGGTAGQPTLDEALRAAREGAASACRAHRP